MTKRQKEYTAIRQCYAWVGFITIATLMLMAVSVFIPSVSVYEREVREQVKEITNAVVTAYSSSPDETDDTPFTTASNQTVRDGIVANNCLPFGTKVRIGGNEFEVQDRMNRKYGCEHFDVWMPSKHLALEYGKQTHTVIVSK